MLSNVYIEYVYNVFSQYVLECTHIKRLLDA